MRSDDKTIFFFFQAEDGIRDGRVTGVQTCALPICYKSPTASEGREARDSDPISTKIAAGRKPATLSASGGENRCGRSEERRVGKECRDRRAPCHYKNKLFVSYDGDWACVSVSVRGR